MDLTIRELTERVVARRGEPEQPFGLHLLAGTDPAAELCRHVEREVFLEYFGNTSDFLAREYGAYEETSLFLCVIDHRRLAPAGVMRMILPSDAGQKSLHDIERVWKESPDEVFARTGVQFDPVRVWDIATLAVANDYRGRNSEGLISLALYQAAFQTSMPCGARWFVAVLDAVVLELIDTRLARPFSYYSGLEPLRYLDSPASLPVYVDIHDYGRRLREADPTMHALLFEGTGLEPTLSAPDWAQEATELAAMVS